MTTDATRPHDELVARARDWLEELDDPDCLPITGKLIRDLLAALESNSAAPQEPVASPAPVAETQPDQTWDGIKRVARHLDVMERKAMNRALMNSVTPVAEQLPDESALLRRIVDYIDRVTRANGLMKPDLLLQDIEAAIRRTNNGRTNRE